MLAACPLASPASELALANQGIFRSPPCQSVFALSLPPISRCDWSSLPFSGVGICTLTLHSAAPSSGGSPPSTSSGGRDLGLNSCYMIMCYVSVCQSVHNLRSISLDYPGQALLPNWLTKFSKPLSRRGENASPPCTVFCTADYAAGSTPLGCSLFIF